MLSCSKEARAVVYGMSMSGLFVQWKDLCKLTHATFVHMGKL